MGPFAHLGITAGTAVLANSIWQNRRLPKRGASPSGKISQPRNSFWRPLSLPSTLAVFFGAIVSDLIDKPIGNFFFVNYFSNGRIFAHTLLFLASVTAVGVLYWAFTDKGWILIIAFGIFMHLILDQMWLEPGTLFWPLYGTAFPRDPNMEPLIWLRGVLHAIVSDPRVILSELVGLIIFGWLFIKMVIDLRLHKPDY